MLHVGFHPGSPRDLLNIRKDIVLARRIGLLLATQDDAVFGLKGSNPLSTCHLLIRLGCWHRHLNSWRPLPARRSAFSTTRAPQIEASEAAAAAAAPDLSMSSQQLLALSVSDFDVLEAGAAAGRRYSNPPEQGSNGRC